MHIGILNRNLRGKFKMIFKNEWHGSRDDGVANVVPPGEWAGLAGSTGSCSSFCGSQAAGDVDLKRQRSRISVSEQWRETIVCRPRQPLDASYHPGVGLLEAEGLQLKLQFVTERLRQKVRAGSYQPTVKQTPERSTEDSHVQSFRPAWLKHAECRIHWPMVSQESVSRDSVSIWEQGCHTAVYSYFEGDTVKLSDWSFKLHRVPQKDLSVWTSELPIIWERRTNRESLIRGAAKLLWFSNSKEAHRSWAWGRSGHFPLMCWSHWKEPVLASAGYCSHYSSWNTKPTGLLSLAVINI